MRYTNWEHVPAVAQIRKEFMDGKYEELFVSAYVTGIVYGLIFEHILPPAEMDRCARAMVLLVQGACWWNRVRELRAGQSRANSRTESRVDILEDC